MSVSKATCLESVLKTVQIILWETPVTKSSRKVFKNVTFVRVMPLITNLASFFNNKFFLKFRSVHVQNFLCFFIYPVFYSQWTVKNFSIRDGACKLWDKFLISMIILILIISYILMFYRNFESIFEFMALKRAPICGRNVCLAFFFSTFISNSDNFNGRE